MSSEGLLGERSTEGVEILPRGSEFLRVPRHMGRRVWFAKPFGPRKRWTTIGWTAELSYRKEV